MYLHVYILSSVFFLAARTNMTEFWKEHSREATVEEMMLDSRARELTQYELPEILSILPCLSGSDVLELGAGIGWDVWTGRCLFTYWFYALRMQKGKQSALWCFVKKFIFVHNQRLQKAVQPWPCFIYLFRSSRDSEICTHLSLQSLHQPPADQSQTRDGCGFHGELCGEKPREQWSPQQRDIHSG